MASSVSSNFKELSNLNHVKPNGLPSLYQGKLFDPTAKDKDPNRVNKYLIGVIEGLAKEIKDKTLDENQCKILKLAMEKLKSLGDQYATKADGTHVSGHSEDGKTARNLYDLKCMLKAAMIHNESYIRYTESE